MSSTQTLVCVKQVKQEVVEEWDETMPLPGDIIEGIAEDSNDELLFVKAKGRSDFSLQLGKISRRREDLWLKVRRGESVLKLRVCVVPERSSKLQKKFTFRAASSDKHVAVLADLTFDQCCELQEMSRRVVNVEPIGFNQKGVKYDWKMKVGTYLPDRRSTVVSSIIFMSLATETCAEATTVRAMAWFTAAVSSGVPLVFINIQTEQIITSDKASPVEKETIWGRQQNHAATIQIMQGIRLWFLPGIEEKLVELTPQHGELRFGMDIKRTEEGFICVHGVTRGTAADRAGLRQLYEEAQKTKHLVIISRLEGKSLMPSKACSVGLIHCCDNADIKETLTSAMEDLDSIKLHIMSWPNNTTSTNPLRRAGAATLRPPT
ncbi:Plant regulator RWP-RK [Heracleum sosnowskyi]|uniref:Plant regulator RWP-RK n=1 Tax=Heracleum sosnowskyi TaxID=360622 RepID=A0AAD8I0C3_9APIA|nr:Plant regulator RWP-RK [Heracleum sosnowskyi]